MKFDKHGNGQGLDDLFILPETKEEQDKITAFLKSKGLYFQFYTSDVQGHEWYGKRFIDVPFCEVWREDIEKCLS